jgi:hypothetical protein
MYIHNSSNNNNNTSLHPGELVFRNDIFDSISIENILEAITKFDKESKSQLALIMNRIIKKIVLMAVTLPDNFPTGSYGLLSQKKRRIVLEFLPTIDPKYIDSIKKSILIKGHPDDKPNTIFSPSKKRKHPDISNII